MNSRGAAQKMDVTDDSTKSVVSLGRSSVKLP